MDVVPYGLYMGIIMEMNIILYLCNIYYQILPQICQTGFQFLLTFFILELRLEGYPNQS